MLDISFKIAPILYMRLGAFFIIQKINIMEILLQLIYSGIALGMIYAVIAFGYQLTFATSDTLNFGQGDALMLGALVGLTLVDVMQINYWLALACKCSHWSDLVDCGPVHRGRDQSLSS